MSHESTLNTPGSYEMQGAGSGGAHDGDGDDLQLPSGGATDEEATETQELQAI